MFGRKALGLALAAVLCLGVAGTAIADESGHGDQHVFVLVQSNITIGGGSPTYPGGETPPGGHNGGSIEYVDLGIIQTGKFCGTLRWRIDANTEAVKFCIGASDLWKGDDPIGASVAPIPLKTEWGVDFSIDYGGPVGTQNPHRPFKSQGKIGDFPSYMTDYITFESSQSGHFSQYVYTKLCWDQDDAEKPQGQYSGVVELWGFVVPHLI